MGTKCKQYFHPYILKVFSSHLQVEENTYSLYLLFNQKKWEKWKKLYCITVSAEMHYLCFILSGLDDNVCVLVLLLP